MSLSGTGLSDQTDAPRSSANIAEEVHEALQHLGVGITRALQAIAPDPYRGADYDEATKEQMRLLAARNTAAPTMVDEMSRADDNFADAQSMSVGVLGRVETIIDPA